MADIGNVGVVDDAVCHSTDQECTIYYLVPSGVLLFISYDTFCTTIFVRPDEKPTTTIREQGTGPERGEMERRVDWL